MKILSDFHWLHKFVTLPAEVMFVNSIAFLVTFSQNIKLLNVEHVPTCTGEQLAKSLMNIVKLYTKGDLFVKVILMDKDFDKSEDQVGPLEINTIAAGEHVAKIGQHIRLVKERTRYTTAALLEYRIKYLHKN